MSKIIALWNAEPVALLGIAGTIVVFALEQFAGHGLISSDTVQSLVNLGAALAPFVISLLGRSQASSPATITALTTPTDNASDVIDPADQVGG